MRICLRREGGEFWEGTQAIFGEARVVCRLLFVQLTDTCIIQMVDVKVLQNKIFLGYLNRCWYCHQSDASGRHTLHENACRHQSFVRFFSVAVIFDRSITVTRIREVKFEVIPENGQEETRSLGSKKILVFLLKQKLVVEMVVLFSFLFFWSIRRNFFWE